MRGSDVCLFLMDAQWLLVNRPAFIYPADMWEGSRPWYGCIVMSKSYHRSSQQVAAAFTLSCTHWQFRHILYARAKVPSFWHRLAEQRAITLSIHRITAMDCTSALRGVNSQDRLQRMQVWRKLTDTAKQGCRYTYTNRTQFSAVLRSFIK
jgi:hypothetical protein